MSLENYPNRMIENYEGRNMKTWPAVIITKGIPGHPEGAIRYPRPEQRETWEKMGVCRLSPEHDRKTAPKARPVQGDAAPDVQKGGEAVTETVDVPPAVTETVDVPPAKKKTKRKGKK